jgi:hypothetical protein
MIDFDRLISQSRAQTLLAASKLPTNPDLLVQSWRLKCAL